MPPTQLLLEEAAHIFSKLGNQRVSNFVSISDFQDYWQHASEDTQSSFSGCHFGHYIAASKDLYLSALHAANILLATSTGTPLKRWGTSLTILLEKIAGNIFIDKMRAIHLLEADYNWMNKLIFAKRMMDLAHGQIIVPPKQFAKQGTQEAEGVLSTVLFCDII